MSQNYGETVDTDISVAQKGEYQSDAEKTVKVASSAAVPDVSPDKAASLSAHGSVSINVIV